jgi:DNA polymerase
VARAARLAERERALAALRGQVRRCERCALAAGRIQAVPGVGPADARVLFVGEAPGRQEDVRGEPFVGAAGRTFDALLASVGLRRDQVYITNVVKCRPFIGPPPGRNRAPLPDEIRACRPWLEEELRLVRPEIVVTLGRVALEAFCPGTRISEVHGRPLRRDGLTILPLFHPALARYGPPLREMLEQDFKVLGRLLRRRAAAKEGAGWVARLSRSSKPSARR